MQEGNLEPLDAIYSGGPGVHIIEGAGVNHDWADYRDHHLVPELETFKDVQYRFFFAIEPQVRGNLAYTALRYELSADLENGHIELECRGTFVLEKIGAQWRIVHTHTSGRANR
jgi:ketosteroid isomerase-like protein